MANELIVKQQNELVETIDKQGLDKVLEPLIKEIHLFDTYIAGTTHLQDQSVLEKVQPGDSLTLRREDNKFDGNAILILNEADKKLGYIPEKDNIIFARLMDAGKLLKAKVKDKKQRGSFTQISVGIYLVDF